MSTDCDILLIISDMEWMTGTDSNEVDIGFIPEMRLTSTQPSFPSEPESEMPVVDVPFDENSIAWDEHIPLDEAKVVLERTFYPFKKVSVVRVYVCGLL